MLSALLLVDSFHGYLECLTLYWLRLSQAFEAKKGPTCKTSDKFYLGTWPDSARGILFQLKSH